MEFVTLEKFTKNSKRIIRLVSKVKQVEWPKGFQEVKVPRFRDNGTGWW